MTSLAADLWRTSTSYARTAVIALGITTVTFIAVAGFRLGVLSVSVFAPLVLAGLLVSYMHRLAVSRHALDARTQAIYLSAISIAAAWSILTFATTPGEQFFHVLSSPEVSYVSVSTAAAMNREAGRSSEAARNAVSLFDRATTQLNERNYPRAVNLYQHSSAILPTSAAQMNAAFALFRIGEFRSAEQEIAGGLEIARKHHDAVLEAGLLALQGNIYNKEGRLTEARDSLELARLGNRRIRNYQGEANTLGSLSLVLSRLSKFDESKTAVEEALQLHEIYGPRSAVVDDHLALGDLFGGRGEKAKAKQEIDSALSLAHVANDALGEAKAQTMEAQFYTSVGSFSEAKMKADIALATFKSKNDLLGQIHVLGVIAWISALEGHSALAINVYSMQLDLAQRGGELVESAAALINMGNVQLDEASPQAEEAQRNFQRALALSTTMGARMLTASASLGLAAAYILEGNTEEAKEQAQKALILSEYLNYSPYVAQAWYVIGNIRVAEHDISGAKEAYSIALNFYRLSGTGYQREMETVGRKLNRIG